MRHETLPILNTRRDDAYKADAQTAPRSPTVRARHGSGNLSTTQADIMSAVLPVSTGASAAGGRRKGRADSGDEGGAMPAKPGGVRNAISTVQRPLLVGVGATAAAAAAVLLRKLDGEAVGLFYLYYQPLIPAVVMLWAWAVAVGLFEARAIKYDVCFSPRDQQRLLPASALYQFSAAALLNPRAAARRLPAMLQGFMIPMAALVSAIVAASAAAFTWLCWQDAHETAAWAPPATYMLLAGLLFLPFNVVHKDTRLFFGATLGRVCSPWREVTWADFLLADFLTSLAKPAADAERALCHMLTGPVMDPSPRVCSGASWLVPAAWAAPFAFRFCQCIRVWADTGATPQLWNALKYSTAFPVIGLSAAKAAVTQADWVAFYRPLWIGACALNSSFSYFWDVERDWEISWFTNTRGERLGGVPAPLLRDHLFFPRGLYQWLLGSNAVLRLAWLHKLAPGLRRSHGAVLGFAILEVLRRAQWAPVRIEVELRKLQAARPELGRLVPLAAPPGVTHKGGGDGDGSGSSRNSGGRGQRNSPQKAAPGGSGGGGDGIRLQLNGESGAWDTQPRPRPASP